MYDSIDIKKTILSYFLRHSSYEIITLSKDNNANTLLLEIDLMQCVKI